MIIIDFSSISMGAFFAQRTNTVDEGLIRHQILNTIRMYNVKFRQKYGQLILAADGGSWRKNVFPEYKGARKVTREESDIDWNEVWRVFNLILDEIKDHLPYKVVKVRQAEADDIIATLVETTQEFGNSEPVMIVSTDKDFIQLQKYSNVDQFCPKTKKLIVEKNPRRYLQEHILRGCGTDGVPNVLSANDTFLNPDLRQASLTSKVLEGWVSNFSKLEELMTPEVWAKFKRNRECIDLSYIPDDISNQILQEYDNQPKTPNSKAMNYLISKKCRLLVGSVADFFPAK